MADPYVSYRRCRYNSKHGVIIPTVIRESMESRNSPPFTLYTFLRTEEDPHVELFDDYSRRNGELPHGEYAELKVVPTRRSIRLPGEFEEALGIEDFVEVLGNWYWFEIWAPDAWKRFREPREARYQEIMEEGHAGLLDEALAEMAKGPDDQSTE